MQFKILQRLRSTLLLLGLCASGSIVQAQPVYTFTNAGATGINGPTQAQVTAAYASTTLAGSVTVTGGIQSWTVPTSGPYKIEVYGANGYGLYGGKGAYMSGEFNLNANDVLKILVGQMGQCCSGAGTNQYGGGGGSFVVAAVGNTPLIIAGGGGGGATFYPNSSTNLATAHNPAADASITTTAKTAVGSTVGTGGTAGNGGGAGGTAGGGGGFLTNGLNAGPGGFAFVNGGVGGSGTTPTGLGGFGGGGGITGQNNMRAGGGGGYSGGGGAGSSTTVVQIGGGGGSYNSGTNQVNTPALGTGHGLVVITFLVPPCNAPTNVKVSNITTTTATATWGPTPQLFPAVGSEYVISTSATPPASGTYSATSTVNLSGLTPNTVYYFHVRNQCPSPSGFSGWTTISFITSDLNCAVSPSALAATNITYNSADLSWNAISGVTGYEYIVDQNPVAPSSGSGTPIVGNNFNTGATLNHGQTYYLHVRTACAGPTYSSWTTLSFNTLLCDTPNVSNAINITVNSATVWWNPVPGVLGYEYAVTTSVTPPASGTFTTNTLENVSSLNAGTTYYLHVRSNCDVNIYSLWKTYSFQTLPCSAPAAAVSGITFNSANISWVALAGALGYEYSFGTVATPPATGTATTALSYATGTVLTPNTTYYFHVRAQCGPTTFSPWTTVSFTTLTCLPPVGLSFTNITTGSVTMNWGAPGAPSSTASGYEYVISQSTATPAGAGVFNAGTVVTASNITVPPNSPLLPDTWYYVHVRSICYPNGGISDWILDSFKTLEPCPPVTGLKVSNVWFDAIDVTWNSAPYSNYYQYSIGTASLPPSVGTNITDTTFRARGLRDDAVYYAHVRSMCTQVPSSLWETIQFKTTSLSVKGINSSTGALTAYPNPVTDKVTVEWSGQVKGTATIQLTDVTGKVLKTIPVESVRTEIELSELSPAIYLLRYHDEEQQAIIRINKE